MTEYIGWLDEDHAPVVDMAQEVVRCRDCLYYQKDGMWGVETFPVCHREVYHFPVTTNGFCAWGKRKN